jgi:hypothetical protein
MNIEEIINENIFLKEKIQKLESELIGVKEHLKKYTAPICKKIYYENNKEIIKQKHKEYKPTEEQKKQWARTAYLKKKEKLEKEKSLNI